MSYVDLNPIRAGIAQDLPTSKHTSAMHRIAAIEADARTANQSLEPIRGSAPAHRRLPITCAAYLDLIDWTGRRVRDDKRGAIDAAAPSILARLGLREEAWHHQVLGIEDRYWRVIGNAQAMIEKAAAIGQRWLKGIGNAPRGVASQAT